MRDFKKIIIVIGLPLVLILAMWFMVANNNEDTTPRFGEVTAKFYANEVAEFSLNLGSGELRYYLREDPEERHTYTVANINSFLLWVGDFVETHNQEVISANPDVAFEDLTDYLIISDYAPPGRVGSIISSLAPVLLVVVLLVVIWIFMMRRMSAGMGGGDKTFSFGKAKFKQGADSARKTTFADVAGADEEKEELKELVDFLRSPQKFNDLGARIPKGVLMVGPPGTGKTLLSRAVAGEAGVPFFSISGSDFVEMFVGVGASRVRDLFQEAKKNAPSIIFIDEIDAVGRQRGAGLGGGHDEREQTLNQLLVEMDGFGANEGVIIIAATNRADILDKALLRPGRFDRQVVVNYPDVKGRYEILQVHAKGKPLAPDVNLKEIAQSTVGFTGADLENVLNEAALLAARVKFKAITKENIEDATIKVIMGTEKKSHVISDEDKKITSYHEVGHALVSYFLKTQDPVHQISIIPRGMAAGYTMYLPEDDKRHISRRKLLEDISSLLGGRAAEELTQDDICTGASNDIMRATEIARKMVTQFGMSAELGPVLYAGSEQEVFLGRDFASGKEHSDKTARLIDEEVSRIITTQYKIAIDILRENIGKLHEISAILVKREKISGEDFRKFMEGANPFEFSPDYLAQTSSTKCENCGAISHKNDLNCEFCGIKLEK